MLTIKNGKRIWSLVALMSLSLTALSQNKEDEWQLVWEDDFEVDGAPDPSNWSFAGRGTPDWKCYCTDSPETYFVEGGLLHLKASQHTDPADSVKYQTGCIQTKERFSFRYGKLEVRAKLSKGKGSWPAIWMMPEDSKYGGWPNSGEIDVMEHLNYDPFVYQTLHSHHIDRLEEKDNPPYYATQAFDVDEFNVYGVEWFEDRLDFFVNGDMTFSYPKLEGADDKQWPFDQDFYIILNQALGGSWVGEIHDEDLPVQMLVDWVRVYQMID